PRASLCPPPAIPHRYTLPLHDALPIYHPAEHAITPPDAHPSHGATASDNYRKRTVYSGRSYNKKTLPSGRDRQGKGILTRRTLASLSTLMDNSYPSHNSREKFPYRYLDDTFRFRGQLHQLGFPVTWRYFTTRRCSPRSSNGYRAGCSS